MEAIVASGPVIIKNGKLLVNKDTNDDFYKLPGGKLLPGESAEDACKRETKEEVGGEIEIIKPLNTQILWKRPGTNENLVVVLMHYLAKLKNKGLRTGKGIAELKWIDVKDIKNDKYKVGPNIKFLIERGDIK